MAFHIFYYRRFYYSYCREQREAADIILKMTTIVISEFSDQKYLFVSHCSSKYNFKLKIVLNHVNLTCYFQSKRCVFPQIFISKSFGVILLHSRKLILYYFSLIIKRTLTLSMPASKQTMQISINTLEVVVFLMVFN